MAETTIELPAFPWAWHQQGDANDHVLLASGSQWVIAFRTNGEFMPEKEEAVIRHLVASANACAGVTAEDFKSGAVMVCGSNQVAYFDKVLQQRDGLLVEFAAYKEGSEEAFGTVVAQKQSAEARLKSMQTTIDSQQGVICTIRDQRDELLVALEGLHKVCSLTLSGKDGQQHTYFETRAGHFVEATQAMQQAEAAIASVKGK